ncbi:bifunctional 5,10-methylenetetrahydrofolate dehydrogenase/5,10-methenyltetrahydrofolate cyclohydrolase [Candidatus Saccharibacteria bacterium]|nr:bifunctional 5,10-methylenetetrahydrofolate dehydrogenase/5,10-methenyltetrahydrofolate cyclohydrolase [Candidatus Saccharibacteria bacterium]
MTKILDGRELSLYIKERQARQVRNLKARNIFPKLLIIRDSDNPVITKYVNLKRRYGEDVGIEVVDKKIDKVNDTASLEKAKKTILEANADQTVSGIIVQLPLVEKNLTDDVVNLIDPKKDVDGLNQTTSPANRKFESATATAINWLMAGNGIELNQKKVALVGYGRLVGQPLARIMGKSGVAFEIFRHDSDLSLLKNYDVIITATGVPRLIKSAMVKPGAVVIDAGTASEDGVLVGDVDESVRKRDDLSAITPKIGGVGPMTVTVLFDDVIVAAEK